MEDVNFKCRCRLCSKLLYWSLFSKDADLGRIRESLIQLRDNIEALTIPLR
jgi:hypothetical protein